MSNEREHAERRHKLMSVGVLDALLAEERKLAIRTGAVTEASSVQIEVGTAPVDNVDEPLMCVVVVIVANLASSNLDMSR